jgi:hypothetical protein
MQSHHLLGCVFFTVLGLNSQQSNGQSVGPRRETQVLDDLTVDEGEVSEEELNDDDRELEDVLQDKPSPHSERRAQLGRGIALSIGSARPWQRSSLALYQGFDEWTNFGIFAGFGQGSRDGRMTLRSFDLNLEARVIGLMVQRWLKEPDHLRVEGALGYVTWDGRLTPRGQVEGEDSLEDSLSTGFLASGLFVSASLQYSWIFDGGWTLDWTILGVQKSYVLKLDQSRPSGYGGSAIRLGLTGSELFGLTGLGIGYRF